jgi:adenylate cyclase
MASTRRLITILAADVVGYSRLMGLDEEGTHERLKAHRRELLDPEIEEHRGKIIKNIGDGMLAEFQSVVEAVLCAVKVQCGMTRRNAFVSEHERISFRIGINIGDVISESEDIFGDGVNITARLEGLAEPDGICISRMVHDQIRDKLPYPFEDIGPQRVKNIARPLHAFALRRDAIAALAASDRNPATPPAAPAVANPAAAGAPRLSIVVLPFARLSSDRTKQYLADAITDDVTTDLSRIADMIVISRNTAFTYKDKPVDARRIGRELNVRYLLEGSVRRIKNRVRVNIQLIDAETNTHVWADRFDHDTDDLFTLQDTVTAQIAAALNLELFAAEAARSSTNPDAFDCILRGRAAFDNAGGLTRQAFATAIEWFEKALTIDPPSIGAQAQLALALSGRVLEQMSDSVTADLAKADQLIGHVLAISPRDPIAHFAKGQVFRAQQRYEAAIPEYEAAVASNRNWVLALAALSWCRFLSGSIEDTISVQEQAIRLSPRDPRLPNWHWRIGMVCLLRSQIEDAIPWLEKARSGNPSLPGPHAWLAAAHALQDNSELATSELAEARRLSGDGRYSSIARYAQFLAAPKLRTLAESTFFAGLRMAGVAEE